MSRRLRFACALLAVSATVSLTPAAASATPNPDLWVARDGTNELVTMIDGDHTTFSGVYVDENTRVVTVQYPVRNGRKAAFGRLSKLAGLAKAGGTAGSWRVSFAPATYSRAELEAVKRRVETDAEWRRLTRPVLANWYIDPVRNKVIVGLTEVTPALRGAAARTFGTMVELETAQRIQPAGRFDDAIPYHAGDRLNFPPRGNQCTSGFTIRSVSNPNFKRSITAGHCAPAGAVVNNGRDRFGKVDFSQVVGLDVAYISNGTFHDYFPGTWIGGISDEIVRDVRGFYLPVVGHRGVCPNGSFTGERCAGFVNAVGLCEIVNTGNQVCNLTRLGSTDGRPLVQHGDSGGPVHRYGLFGDVHMSGMIVAMSGTSAYYHPFNVIMPAGWQLDIA